MARVKERAGTREKLLEAALDAFSAHGYQGASIRDICSRADANVAALNYHWGSKEKLFLAVSKECTQRLLRIASSSLRFPVKPDEVLEDVVGALFDTLSLDPRPIRILVWLTLQAESLDYEGNADAFQPVLDLLFSYLETLKGEGLFADVDIDVALGLLQGMLAFQFIDRAGHRRFFKTDLSDSMHAARVKGQMLRAARLLLGRPA